MKKHKFLKLLVVCIILVAICLIVCFAVCTMKYSTKKMTVYLKDGNSYASNWTYDMSVEGVLAECNHQVLYAYAGDYQYWEFEAVGVGEVTIHYTAKYETEVLEEKCFSVTYYVSEDGNITELSDNNKPPAYDKIPNNPFKVFAIRAGHGLFVFFMRILLFIMQLFGW